MSRALAKLRPPVCKEADSDEICDLIPPPGRRKVPEAVRNAAAQYRKEYKRVYGLSHEISWDGEWISVRGAESRVKLRRFRELITRLQGMRR